jgi:hypothetical protein
VASPDILRQWAGRSNTINQALGNSLWIYLVFVFSLWEVDWLHEWNSRHRETCTACRVGRSLKSNSVRTQNSRTQRRYTDGESINGNTPEFHQRIRCRSVFICRAPQFIHMRTCRGCRSSRAFSRAYKKMRNADKPLRQFAPFAMRQVGIIAIARATQKLGSACCCCVCKTGAHSRSLLFITRRVGAICNRAV